MILFLQSYNKFVSWKMFLYFNREKADVFHPANLLRIFFAGKLFYVVETLGLIILCFHCFRHQNPR